MYLAQTQDKCYLLYELQISERGASPVLPRRLSSSWNKFPLSLPSNCCNIELSVGEFISKLLARELGGMKFDGLIS